MTAETVQRDQPRGVRRRSPRFLRVLVLLLLPVAILLVLIVGLVQIVLWSDIPRARIVHELQMETGLRFEAASSRTRWGGVTELRDISIALPLESEPFLRIPMLRLQHTPLARILGGFEVQEALVDQPLLRLRQDEYGRWNAMRAIEIVQAMQANKSSSGDMPPLPRIELRGGTVDMLGEDGQVLETPLAFEGEPESPVAWAFKLMLGDALAAEGRVAPRGEWQHQIEVVFGRDQALLQALLPDEVLPLRGAAQWRGGLENGQFVGRVHLEQVQMREFAAQGDAVVIARNGRITLRPRGIVFGSMDSPDLSANLLSGAVTLEGSTAELHRVRIEGGGATMEVEGTWDLERLAGEVAARWSGMPIGPVLAHQGEAKIRAVLPAAGGATLSAEIQTHGSTREGTWESQLQLAVRGATWEQMIGELTAQRLIWRDDQGELDFSGAMAQVESQWPEIRLNRIVIPGAEHSRMLAQFDAEALVWRLEAEAAQWDVPRVRGGALDLFIRADGDAQRVRVPELRAAGDHFIARASGDYDLRRDLPLRAAARVAYRMPGDERGRPSGDEPLADAGSWLALAEVMGQIQPLNLRLDGELLGQDVRIGGAPVDHVSIPFTASANEDAASFASGSFGLLGGDWRVEGRYIDRDRTVALVLQANDLPIDSIVRVVDLPLDVPGVAQGRFMVTVPGLDLDDLAIEGEFTVAGIERPGLLIEEGRGRVETRHGVLTLRDLEMAAGESQMRGEVEFNLRERGHVHLDLELERWPFSHEELPVTAVMDGHAAVDVLLSDLSLRGRVEASADVAHEGAAVGRLATVSMLDGRRIEVQSIRGDFCQGAIDGSGLIVLDDWLQNRGQLSMDAVDLGDLIRCLGIEEDLSGFASLQVQLGRAEDARAPEPMALAIDIDTMDASFRTIGIGDARVRAYFGPTRAVLDRSTFNLADGSLTLWSRLSRHGEERFVHVQADLEGLDIDQVYRAFEPEGGDLPGRMTGQLAFGGYTEPPHRLFGEGRLAIYNSDLANLPGISLVYNLLNLRMGPQQPRGRGEVRVRLEGDALEIYRLRYFNRGADVAASIRVDNVWAGAESPINGVAAGTLRPARELSVPFLDLDAMLSALQSGAVSVEIGGTLAERDIRPVPFGDVAGRFTRILSGESD